MLDGLSAEVPVNVAPKVDTQPKNYTPLSGDLERQVREAQALSSDFLKNLREHRPVAPVNTKPQLNEDYLKTLAQEQGKTNFAGEQIIPREKPEKKVEDPNVLMQRLLKSVELTEEQIKLLPDHLKKQLENFHPKTEEELDKGFKQIINGVNEVLKTDPKATPTQQLFMVDIKAAVDSGMPPVEIFTELMKQTDEINIPQEQKQEVKNDLNELKKLAETPTTQENVEQQKKSFIDKIPRPLKFLGLGAIIGLIISIWKAMKGAMGAGAGAAGGGGGFPMFGG